MNGAHCLFISASLCTTHEENYGGRKRDHVSRPEGVVQRGNMKREYEKTVSARLKIPNAAKEKQIAAHFKLILMVQRFYWRQRNVFMAAS